MGNQVKRLDASCVHSRFVEDRLELFLFLSNDDYEVPVDWHTSPDFMELHLHFSVTDIFDSMYSDMCTWKPNNGGTVVQEEYRPQFDALKKQLEEALQLVNDIEYVTKEQIDEMYCTWKGLTDEEIYECMSTVSLSHPDKIMGYIRAAEAKLKEKNSG